MGRPRTTDAPRDPFAVRIGIRIREARRAKRWALRELALYSGLDVSRIGNYEAGIRMPGPQEVLALSEPLGEDPAFLMGLAEHRHPETIRSEEEAALLDLFRRADPIDRKHTLERLGTMVQLLKSTPIPDEQLEHLSAKGKPLGERAPAKQKQ